MLIRTLFILAIIALLPVGGGLLAAGRGTGVAETPAAELLLFYSNDVRGELEPCG